MAIETTTPRSRRAILAAALGAGVATIASALGRPPKVAATDGDFVQVGHTYTAGTVTKIDAGGASSDALLGASSSGMGVVGRSTSNVGVSGASVSGFGVGGTSTSSIGVLGHSTSGNGAAGSSSSGIGVLGESSSAVKAAIVGELYGGTTGVQGYSGAFGSAPSAPAKTGVYGYAIQDTAANGVKGQSTVGTGLYGTATTGRGLFASATTGTGAYGYTTSGIGNRGYAATGTAGYFSTSGPKVGTALRVLGKVKLDNCAGVATIASGANSVVVSPGIDLLTTSAVVATLMGSAGGLTTVHRVVVNAATDAFTIYLTANATVAVAVAWIVLG